MELKNRESFYIKYAKRMFDVLLVLGFLLLFWWLYVVLAILVRIKLGAPIIFCQNRPGTGGEIFKLYKFRSMTNETGENGKLLSDTERLTKFGRSLRGTSLDELPELFNVLKGDMSLIGPRPLKVEYLEYYNEYDMRRHEVRPGLTGLAQVNGRNMLQWGDKFKLDVEYVDNLSFRLDVKIFFLTFKKIFVREGINFVEGEHQFISDYFNECGRKKWGDDI